MGATFTVCCCRHYLQHTRDENNAILRMRRSSAPKPPELISSDSSDSDTEEESIFVPKICTLSPQGIHGNEKSRAEARPSRGSCTSSAELDCQLQAFINMRAQTDKDTEEWEKLNYDIHSLRYARREVCNRWKKILLQLGYQCEAEALLCVSTQSQLCLAQEPLNKASQMLEQVLEHSSLFLPGTGPQDRYLHVMDRLVSLDSAEDFIRLAKEKYPKIGA